MRAASPHRFTRLPPSARARSFVASLLGVGPSGPLARTRSANGRLVVIPVDEVCGREAWLRFHDLTEKRLDDASARAALVRDLRLPVDADLLRALHVVLSARDLSPLRDALEGLDARGRRIRDEDVVAIAGSVLGSVADETLVERHAYDATRLLAAAHAFSRRFEIGLLGIRWLRRLDPRIWCLLHPAFPDGETTHLGAAAASHWRAETSEGRAIREPAIDEALRLVVPVTDVVSRTARAPEHP